MPCLVYGCLQQPVRSLDLKLIAPCSSRSVLGRISGPGRPLQFTAGAANFRIHSISGKVVSFPKVAHHHEDWSRRIKVHEFVADCLQVLAAAAAISLALRSGSAYAAVSRARIVAGSESNKLSVALVSAWAGLIAGGLHTLTGPDHLAALAPLCIGRGSKLESAAVGALWGCGHDAGQVLFGLLFLLLKDKLRIELLRTWGARVVGLTLIIIGAVGIKEAQELPMLGEEDQAATAGNLRKRSLGFTFATGIVYGLQPDALLMILPALAMPSRLAGICFLAMFLLGTVLAMSSYTVFLDSCSQALRRRVPSITQKLSLASSLVAIVFGLGVLLSEVFGVSFF